MKATKKSDEEKIRHLKKLIRKAKEAGIEVEISVPTKLN